MQSNSCCAALALIAAFALAPHIGSAQTADAAVAYQIDSRHTGAIRTPGFKPPITVKWAANLGVGARGYPVIAEGKVFVTAEDPMTDAITLYALDSQTGQIVWSQPGGFGYPAGICYDNGSLFYVPSGSATLGSGLMVAFDPSTGNVRWTTTLDFQRNFDSAPTALNGIVYTVGAGYGGTICAVRESDGVVLWTAPVYTDGTPPIVTDEGVYFACGGLPAYKFDPRTGRLLWYTPSAMYGGGIVASVLYDGQLYVGHVEESANVNGLILNAKTGNLAGYFDPGSVDRVYTPAFVGGIGFFPVDSTITAQSVKTGATLWMAACQSQLVFTLPPLVVNDIVFGGEGAFGYPYSPVLCGWNIRNGVEAVTQDLGSYGDFILAMSAAEGMLVAVVGSRVVALGNGIGVSSIVLNPVTVTSMQSAQGTVTLSGPAPGSGLIVQLASTSAAASVPSSVTVLGGRKRATFTVTASNVSMTTTAAIQATVAASTVSAQLTINSFGVSSLILDPSVVTDGGTCVATVTLQGPAPTGGILVAFATSNQLITHLASATLTIPAGATTGQLTIYTTAVTVPETAIISAYTGGGFQNRLLTLEP